MIDFRYHLVSLIAVFLAVTLGIVIGTTALNGPILDDLESQVDALEQDKRSLEDRSQTLEGRLDSSNEFQLAVGDEDRDLDEPVVLEVEPGHLAVDPHQPVHSGEASPPEADHPCDARVRRASAATPVAAV